MSDPGGRVPEWLLERLAAGDLPPARAAELRARLEAQGELGRLNRIGILNRDTLAEHPPAEVAAEVARRLRRKAPRVGLSAFALPVLAFGSVTALALTLSAVRGGPALEPALQEGRGEGAVHERVTEKGFAPQLIVYRSTLAGAERLGATSSVRAGDMLQVAYVAAGQRYGVIASVDATGTVTLHLPEQPGMAALLVPERETPLPHAFELDAAPGFERFVLVSGQAPFMTASVSEALGPTAAPLDPSLRVTELTLRKEAP